MMAVSVLAPVVGVVVCLLIAYSRTATVASVSFGGRKLTIEVSMSPAQMFARALEVGAPFSVADNDEASGRLVLTTRPTFSTWGFFYPVTIQDNGSGGSRVEIGIKSRLFQWGPLVTKWHKKCCKELTETAGALPNARIVAGA